MTGESLTPPSSEQPSARSSRPVPPPIRPWHAGIRPFYRVFYTALQCFARIWLRLEVVNSERIPREGAVLVVSTHTSHLDPPMVGQALGRESYFMARASLLRIPVLGPLIRGLNAYPLRRGASDREAMAACREILRHGWPMVFFPEGTRSHDGRMGPILPGFAMVLAKLDDVPFLPVVIQDTYRSMPRGCWFPRPIKVRMHVGHLERLPERAEGEPSRQYFRRCSELLEKRFRELGAR